MLESFLQQHQQCWSKTLPVSPSKKKNTSRGGGGSSPSRARSLLYALLCCALISWTLVRPQWEVLLQASAAMYYPNHEDDGYSSDYSLMVKDLKPTELPQIAWLLSFPNSGTSYTLAMVERASNRSIASNYGIEFSNQHHNPELVHSDHPEGPFWEGPESFIRFGSTYRPLPKEYVLTKTHCGSRCVHCPAHEYLVNASVFLQECRRTTSRNGTNTKLAYEIDHERVHRAVHVVRHPMNNVVSRFHLNARNSNRKLEHAQRKGKRLDETPLPINAKGFRLYCQRMAEDDNLPRDAQLLWQRPTDWPIMDKYRPKSAKELAKWMAAIPCAPEFARYVIWHNHVVHSVLPQLGPRWHQRTPPSFTVYYEDYGYDLNTTAKELLRFLHLPMANSELKSFRLSDYTQDHFTATERRKIAKLLRALASPETWKRIRHYVRDYL